MNAGGRKNRAWGLVCIVVCAGLAADGHAAYHFDASGDTATTDGEEASESSGSAVTPGADYNGNGVVDLGDFIVWRHNRGAVGTPGTVMGDGTSDDLLGIPDGDVDLHDYHFWKKGLRATYSAAPEASTAVMWAILGLGAMAYFRGRRHPRRA